MAVISVKNKIVDIIPTNLPSIFPSAVSIHANCFVKRQMFSLCRSDIVIMDERNNIVFLEVGCCFDSSLEEAYLTKLVKYQPPVQQISGSAYKCPFLVFTFGSLGHVHKMVTRGLRIVQLKK